jgi:hypothetical protein
LIRLAEDFTAHHPEHDFVHVGDLGLFVLVPTP